MADGSCGLQLDPLHPPKYCPHCAENGLTTKVKKFRLHPDSDELVIMCKNGDCPWPFSVVSPEGATVKAKAVEERPQKEPSPGCFSGTLSQCLVHLGNRGGTPTTPSGSLQEVKTTTGNLPISRATDLSTTDEVPDYAALYFGAKDELAKLEAHLSNSYLETERKERAARFYKEELRRCQRKLLRSQPTLVRDQPLWPRCQACILRECKFCPQHILMFDPFDELLSEGNHTIQHGIPAAVGPAVDHIHPDV